MKINTMCLRNLGVPGILLTLIGCTALGPDFRQPEAGVEAQWLETTDSAIQTGNTGAADWWTVFNDPTLNTLVQQAYQQNLPLQVDSESCRRVPSWVSPSVPNIRKCRRLQVR
jgi:hypothetical protein